MTQLQTTKTVATVTQFLDWQRSGVLVLQPVFQRRHVWRPLVKSQLVNSVVNGYPVPIIFLRQVQDLDTLSMKMEVVDGQQRIRTLLSFIRPSTLSDYDPESDSFTVKPIHNEGLAGKTFDELPAATKQSILGYELSVHIFPSTTSDALIFRLFALLNSTGLNLTKQEIRNAEYHGAFKTLVYDLSFQHLDQWRRWALFSDNAISRMDEAEAVSEYLMVMTEGIVGKRQPNISRAYANYDEAIPNERILRSRFEATIQAIDEEAGDNLASSAFSRPAIFYSLFSAVYSHMYGLASPLKKSTPRSLPADFAQKLNHVSRRIKAKDLPVKVQDAMDKATGDRTRRTVRHTFVMKALGLEPAE